MPHAAAFARGHLPVLTEVRLFCHSLELAVPFPLRDHKRATGFRRHFAPLADPARRGHDLLDAFKRRGIALDALNGRPARRHLPPRHRRPRACRDCHCRARLSRAPARAAPGVRGIAVPTTPFSTAGSGQPLCAMVSDVRRCADDGSAGEEVILVGRLGIDEPRPRPATICRRRSKFAAPAAIKGSGV